MPDNNPNEINVAKPASINQIKLRSAPGIANRKR
jgi:hypothetical protein